MATLNQVWASGAEVLGCLGRALSGEVDLRLLADLDGEVPRGVVVLDVRDVDRAVVLRRVMGGHGRWTLVIGGEDLPEVRAAVARGEVDIMRLPIDEMELGARVEGLLCRMRVEQHRASELRLFAHDLSNPLTAVRMHSEILGMDAAQLGPDSRELIDEMGTVIDSLSLMISGMRNLSRLDSGEVNPRCEFPLDLSALIHGVSKRPVLQSQVQVEVPAGMMVLGDQHLLQNALMEVLYCAVKLAEMRELVHVTGGTVDGMGQLIVCHPMRELPAELHEEILDRYGAVLVHSHKIRSGPMGWSHARKVFEAHGGGLALHINGTGARVEIALPLEA